MENVFTAVIIIFILLFGVLTLSSAFITSQETLRDAWQDVNDRSADLEHTSISAAEMQILNSGNLIEVTLHNNGAVKLADFEDWDVFAEYYDGAETPVYFMGRLSYASASPSNNEWSVDGIYLNAAEATREFYEMGIFDPGEELVLDLHVSPAVGVGQTAQVTVTTANGVSASLIGMRNAPPILLTPNPEMKVADGGTAAITTQALAVEDPDNDPDELVYTVVTAPEQGTLTPEDSFTQAQIDDGEVVYRHTGEGEDSFTFTVSDGMEEIGEYTFEITVNTPPVVEASVGLTLPAGGTAVITNLLLQTTDADEDDPPSDLIYTIVQFPSNGVLSLGSTFSQADVDNNLLTYTHTDTDADMFTFVVSDGYDMKGTYPFLIELVEAQP